MFETVATQPICVLGCFFYFLGNLHCFLNQRIKQKVPNDPHSSSLALCTILMEDNLWMLN